jgi:hypothetical protein
MADEVEPETAEVAAESRPARILDLELRPWVSKVRNIGRWPRVTASTCTWTARSCSPRQYRWNCATKATRRLRFSWAVL